MIVDKHKEEKNMKIEIQEPAFKPIMITIQTQQEKDMFRLIFGSQGTVSRALFTGRVVEECSILSQEEMRQIMTNSGIYNAFVK
jgi:hypothetical protein